MAGATFAEGLDNLPLLQFALTLLWERQDNGRLTHNTAVGIIGGSDHNPFGGDGAEGAVEGIIGGGDDIPLGVNAIYQLSQGVVDEDYGVTGGGMN